MKPLQGVRVFEFEGLGPAPLAGWMLASHGAEVTVVARPGGIEMARTLGGDPEDNPLRPNAHESSSFRLGSGGINGSAGADVTQSPGKRGEDRQRHGDNHHLPGILSQAEPLKVRRQVLHDHPPSTAGRSIAVGR